MDNFAYLRNAHQIGNDCGLHAVIVPVLLQAGIPLHILEKNPAAASEELRIRMTLTFARNENFFVTESNQDVALTSSQVGSLEEVLMWKMCQIRSEWSRGCMSQLRLQNAQRRVNVISN